MEQAERRSLDDIQEWAIGNIVRHAQTHVSGVYEAATGTGKTRAAAKLFQLTVPSSGRPGLFLANRVELIRQTQRAFRSFGLGCEIEMASLHAAPYLKPDSLLPRPDVVIASHLSMHPDRITEYDRDAFGWIVADEAHLATSDSWTHIFDYFRSSYRLGLSATPYRMDGQKVYGPGAPFEEIVCRYGIADAIADGNLVPIRGHVCGKDLDISAISTRGMDFDPEQMEAFILEHMDELCNAAADQFEKLGTKKAMIFTPDVMSSKVAAKVLTKLGYPTLAVHGNSQRHPMSEDRRRAILESFEKDEVFGLANCELCTTGYDCPSIDAIVMMLVTKSLVGFIQRVGRGTRNAPGKDHLDVIGYSWEGAEGVITTVDLFGVEYDDLEIRQRARQKAKGAAPGTDLNALMNEARAEIEAERRQAEEEAEAQARAEAEELAVREREKVARQSRKLKVMRRKTSYLVESFEPFRDAIAARMRQQAPAVAQAAVTAGQARFLAEHEIDAGMLDVPEVHACIDEILYRQAWGLASPAQEAWLVRAGLATPKSARTWTADEARNALVRSIRRGRRVGA